MGATAFTGIAFSMQQLLLSWILIGILHLPGDKVGLLQAMAGIPGFFLMLLGGANADQRDPRSLLISVYMIAPILPTFLAAMVWLDYLNMYTVLVWGVGISVVMSYSTPAQQAILNRIAGTEIQRAVTASTVIMFLVQMLGLAVAGQLDTFGLATVLLIQAICIGIGALTIRKVTAVVIPPNKDKPSMPRVIAAGIRAVIDHKVIRHTLIVNFISSIFNAGAFMTVFPFIINRVYEGDALTLAIMMIVFYGGATVSNIIMYKIMPILRPGKFFLIMQLSRVLILGILWFEPPFWLMTMAVIGWGLNMGCTTSLSRTIVQESAAPEFRARILSVYSLGLLGSAPIGAIVLGTIIEAFGTLNALVPALFVSTGLFLYGILFTGIYRYESPAMNPSS